MDFANLTADEVDALDGPCREAWYAWCRGDHAKADAILASYGFGQTEAAVDPKPQPRRRKTARPDEL